MASVARTFVAAPNLVPVTTVPAGRVDPLNRGVAGQRRTTPNSPPKDPVADIPREQPQRVRRSPSPRQPPRSTDRRQPRRSCVGGEELGGLRRQRDDSVLRYPQCSQPSGLKGRQEHFRLATSWDHPSHWTDGLLRPFCDTGERERLGNPALSVWVSNRQNGRITMLVVVVGHLHQQNRGHGASHHGAALVAY